MAESDFGKVSNGRNHTMTSKQTKKAPATPKAIASSSQAITPKTAATVPAHARTQDEVPVQRFYTKAGIDPLDQVTYERRSSTISNPDGSVVFKMEGAEVPAGWSQLATDIVISKYFRKAGLQSGSSPSKTNGVGLGEGERSVRQVVYRIAHTIRTTAEAFGGYFASTEAADTFEAELSYLLVNQYGAFNSPVWFNCGLYHQYGIEGSGGNWAWNPEAEESELAADGTSTTEVVETANAYGRPQCSACFIQSVQDDLMGIYELVKSEARLFKYGSGTGTNFSAIRGKQEKLSGGGTSSGLMSFLEVFDRAAGATKSGGTTRRAAKMVCLDVDHPEIVDFIEWKMREEKKAHALIRAGYSSDFNGDAYHTISGQNSNNSVRVTDEFMKAVLAGGKWHTRMRLTGNVCETFEAKDLWRKIAEAAWGCADPGMQYDSTINRWHTCSNTSRINASNPCSEYMFLDDSACNLASVNLIKFLREDGSFDIEGYRHACRIFFVAQEILVDLSSYPTKRIAQNSHDYRPLGLGYANLGSLLMQLGVPYDSDQGRAIAAALTAIMCGHAYKASAEMAKSKGAFVGFAKNREPMLRVMNMHRDAAYSISRDDCWLPGEQSGKNGESGSQTGAHTGSLYRAACEDWDEAVRLGEMYGYRNAQSTVLAPTGTIGLLMDCDTTGIEPDFALVKFKKLAGGGYFKIVNQSVPAALARLGYAPAEVQEIVAYVSGTNTLLAAPHINRRTLKEKGFTDEDLTKVETALPGVFDLDSAFAPWVLGEAAHTRLSGGTKGSLLEKLGFGKAEIAEAGDVIIGRMTIEGAPHLKAAHYAVFDCANRCGKTGQRYLAPMSHVKMMAATQPFLSGAISKTVNLPNDATIDDVAKLYEEGWRLGLKAVALYRDGCKASQPLSSSGESKSDKVESKADAKSTSNVPATGIERLDPLPSTADQGPQLTLALTPKGTREYGVRIRLPKKRRGFTQEARVGGHKIFLRTGEYEDGRLGEIFIDMHKEGAAFRSLMNCFAMSVSVGLQYGVPLETYIDQFTFTRFEPQGVVEGHPNVKLATSIVDYLFRVLGVEYKQRYDLAHVKPEEGNPTLAAADVRNTVPTHANASIAPTKEATARSAAIPNSGGTLEQPGSASLVSVSGDGAQAGSSLSAHLDAMMGDAPVCDVCGHITVRNGACYKCLNCGNSMGCS
ncbi:vitamin B12-dependent ribonucleotide reductase [Pendulispora albinea]|uniref:Vitamin B12-dependent ribonucleotide reductase n=1 Tax=Pendulispora albinea TaxID=2741071 RepID=A0ABZ2LPU1_9BACT